MGKINRLSTSARKSCTCTETRLSVCSTVSDERTTMMLSMMMMMLELLMFSNRDYWQVKVSESRYHITSETDLKMKPSLFHFNSVPDLMSTTEKWLKRNRSSYPHAEYAGTGDGNDDHDDITASACILWILRVRSRRKIKNKRSSTTHIESDGMADAIVETGKIRMLRRVMMMMMIITISLQRSKSATVSLAS